MDMSYISSKKKVFATSKHACLLRFMRFLPGYAHKSKFGVFGQDSDLHHRVFRFFIIFPTIPFSPLIFLLQFLLI